MRSLLLSIALVLVGVTAYAGNGEGKTIKYDKYLMYGELFNIDIYQTGKDDINFMMQTDVYGNNELCIAEDLALPFVVKLERAYEKFKEYKDIAILNNVKSFMKKLPIESMTYMEFFRKEGKVYYDASVKIDYIFNVFVDRSGMTQYALILKLDDYQSEKHPEITANGDILMFTDELMIKDVIRKIAVDRAKKTISSQLNKESLFE